MASPPHVPQLNIPRKRPSVSSVTGGAKKRKPSQLRNSFAPSADTAVGSPLRYSRSPSVDSVATGSVVNGVGGKKRKRKGDDTLSVTGSSIRGGRRGDARSATGHEGEQGENEEEEEEEDVEEMDLEGGKVTEATKKQEKEHERWVYTYSLYP